MSFIREIKFSNLKVKQHNTKAFINGNPMISNVFPRKTHTKDLYSRHDVYRLANQLRQKYANKPLMFAVSLDIPDLGWRSGKSFKASETPILPDKYDWNETGQFVIYVWKATSPSGGKTAKETNDCLWECICDARFPMNEIPFEWRSASKLKKMLGVERTEPIDYKLLPKLEWGVKFNINCVGDYEYTSPHTFLRTLTVKLSQGHYSLVNDRDNKLIKMIQTNPSTLCLYFSDGDTSTCYNGEDIMIRPTEEIEKINWFNDRKITYVRTDLRMTDPRTGERIKKTEANLIQDYDQCIADVEALSVATNGAIDMKKYRYSVSETAKVLVYQHFKTLEDPDEITFTESLWLINTFKGGLMYGEDKELDNGIEYDINSAYPFFMTQPTFDFPMKQGTFQKIDILPQILPYGIYRAKIARSLDPHINKLFRFNELHFYTQFDIGVARKLELGIELIIDDEANCLLYQKGRVKGCSMFKYLLDYLFDLKKQKVPFSKQMINIIWGMLCERRKCIQIARPDSDKEVHIDDATVLSIMPTATGHRIEYVKNDRPIFVHNYARMGVFLTSKVRQSLMMKMYPHREHVYRFHTDGFITDREIPELPVGMEIGQFKVAHQGKCKIHNCMKVEWI